MTYERICSVPDFVLPPAVYSPQLLEAVRYEIEEYLDWYRQTRIQKKVGARNASPEPTHSAETVLVIEAWLAGKAPTLESLEELIDQLKELKLPVVHITLAAMPNHAQRETLVSWFRNNSTPHLLLSFVADRNLGGGILVRTPNHVFDYSWKQQLVNGRTKIAEILKRV
jgi:cobalamin biosynthesis Mg chelatase CobN